MPVLHQKPRVSRKTSKVGKAPPPRRLKVLSLFDKSGVMVEPWLAFAVNFN